MSTGDQFNLYLIIRCGRCSEEVEERKVRKSGRKQAAAGCDWLLENLLKKASSQEKDAKRVFMTKELCKKGGRSKSDCSQRR